MYKIKRGKRAVEPLCYSLLGKRMINSRRKRLLNWTNDDFVKVVKVYKRSESESEKGGQTLDRI